MREILFRGKRRDTGEWVYGDLLHRRIWSHFITVIRVSDDGFDAYKEYEVDSATVCQYTGLTDMNDRWIFEDDILRQRTTEKFNMRNPSVWERYYVVKFGKHVVKSGCADGTAIGWYLLNASGQKKAIGDLEHDNYDAYYPYDVIGNIYDGCCAACESWLEKYQQCENPEQRASDAEAYAAPPDKRCELYEPREVQNGG